MAVMGVVFLIWPTTAQLPSMVWFSGFAVYRRLKTAVFAKTAVWSPIASGVLLMSAAGRWPCLLLHCLLMSFRRAQVHRKIRLGHLCCAVGGCVFAEIDSGCEYALCWSLSRVQLDVYNLSHWEDDLLLKFYLGVCVFTPIDHCCCIGCIHRTHRVRWD